MKIRERLHISNTVSNTTPHKEYGPTKLRKCFFHYFSSVKNKLSTGLRQNLF